jgi:hypothetical protein
MSEIDPWALPQGAAAARDAGIPGGPAPRAVVLAAPLNKKLPIVVMAFAVLYVVISLIEVFALDHEASILNQALADPAGITQDTIDRAQSADDTIRTVSYVALVVFLGTLVSISFWQRSLNTALGSIGARQAVFNRAGYAYFRGTWLVSLVLSLILSATSNSNDITSIQDAVDHDHEYMLYYGLRALVGVVLVFFAFRLKKMSEEGVARLAGGYV